MDVEDVELVERLIDAVSPLCLLAAIRHWRVKARWLPQPEQPVAVAGEPGQQGWELAGSMLP